MNILFFLTPKNDVAFIYSDANLREAIDLMEAHRYSALPILTKQGRYADKLPLRRNRRTDRRCQNMAFPVFFISQKPSIYKPNV